MGAWGAGIFDNDSAYDVLETVTEDHSTTVVEEILRTVELPDDLYGDAPDFLAACAIVASAHGRTPPVSNEADKRLKRGLEHPINGSGRTVKQRLRDVVDAGKAMTISKAIVAYYGSEAFRKESGGSDKHIAETVVAAKAVVSALEEVQAS